MKYTIGMKLRYLPDSKFDAVELVEVVGLRKGNSAKLSNGWVVDEFGIAEGNRTVRGGKIEWIDQSGA